MERVVRVTARLCALVACTAAAGAVPSAAQAGLALPLGSCAWAVKADPDLVNVAFPDEGARYWAGAFAARPAGFPVRMTIRGRFPAARYMSFHVYDGGEPVDALVDEEIVPSSGSNPFRPGADRRDRGTYELQVVLGRRPAHPAPNTLYAAGLNGRPNPAGAILYRVYLPEGGDRGSAPLPELTLTIGSGRLRLPSLLTCPDLKVPPLLNRVVSRGSLPLDFAAPTTRPEWKVATTDPLRLGPLKLDVGSLVFPNLHNQYLRLLHFRTAGDVVAFRAKAPTFPDTRSSTTMGTGQLRYWSVCTNDLLTTRYVSCAADRDVAVDADGFFTIVISGEAHRPRNLRPTDTWLRAGPFPDTHVLYRHMLPAPDFAAAVQRADPRRPQDSMGDYFPDTRACSTAAFERDRCGLKEAP